MAVLNSVVPKYSAIGGGSSILFSGSGFVTDGIDRALIDGVTCSSFVRTDNFSITANSPAHAFTDTPLDAAVFNTTTSAIYSLPGSFYYIKAPFVSVSITEGLDIWGLSGTLNANVLTSAFETFLTFFLAGGTITWSKISGPGTVTFNNQGNKVSGFTASVKGTYVLRGNVINSLGASFSDITVNLHGLPVVNAGADGQCSLGSGYNLVGSATE